MNETMTILATLETINVDEFDVLDLGFQKGNDHYTNAFPSLEITIDGLSMPMLLDTRAWARLSDEAQEILGSPDKKVGTSFIVASIFERWRKDHPSWRVIEGADRNLDEPMIEVP